MTNEDYLSCREYENQTAHPTADHFTTFYHEQSQRYFFALSDANGKVILKSEGYPQQAARENGIQSVLKNKDNRDFYAVKTENGRYFLSLRAANYREIARSCGFDSAAGALALLTYMMGETTQTSPIVGDTTASHTPSVETSSIAEISTSAPLVSVVEKNISTESVRTTEASLAQASSIAVAATAAASVVGNNPVGTTPVEPEDDYLPCREYISHIDLSHHGYNKFRSERTGKYYFAVVDGHDHVSLRSEGYPTEAECDADMDDVQHNILIKERYEVKKIGFYHYFIILRNKSGQEIARSCAHENLEALYDAAPFLAPTLEDVKPSTTEGVALTGVPTQETEIATKKVVETIARPIAAAAPIAEEAAAGGFKWWWLLLPLLALAAWWLFGKGCNEPAAVAPTIATPTLPVEPPKPIETPKAALPAPVVESCNLNWIFFDFNESDLRAASKAELDEMAAILKKNPDYVAILEAYTDFKGSDAYNEALSGRRATNAKQYLVSKGIEAARITTTLNGEKAPVAKNEVEGADTEQGRQFNRRVELFVQDKTGKNICQSIPPDVPSELKVN